MVSRRQVLCVVRPTWISFVWRPLGWPRCLLLVAVVVSLIVVVWWRVFVAVGFAAVVRRRQTCAFRWQGAALTIEVVSRAPVASDGCVHRWWHRLCVGWVCSLN